MLFFLKAVLCNFVLFLFIFDSVSDAVTHFVAVYFRLGFAYKEILHIIAHRHNIVISLRTLYRELRRSQLYRRKNKSDLLTVALFIVDLLGEQGSLYGHRWMHAACVRNGFVISREEIRILLSIIDPVGVQTRTARRLRRRQYSCNGPNAVWHCDGYDKVKPYGLCIHGCIDGFSRQLIWLQVYRTNNDPKIIGSYYMDAVEFTGGAPRVMRTDMGTENGLIEVLQTALVGDNSFRYGKSTANQRIECFWSFLRKQCMQFWMDTFQSMRDDGLFCGDFVDKSLVQFCFTGIVQVHIFCINF